MAWQRSSQALVDLFDASLPDDARVERRKMFGYPAAFANRRMFAGLYQESVVLKLPEDARERLIAERRAAPFEPVPGRRMGAFVALAPGLLADRAALRDWLARALDHVAAQAAKPKPRRAPQAKGRA